MRIITMPGERVTPDRTMVRQQAQWVRQWGSPTYVDSWWSPGDSDQPYPGKPGVLSPTGVNRSHFDKLLQVVQYDCLV
ncbi:MAG: hypothetical protein JSU86_17305 [Phycisphaerales bacterium]|nr:MAG: hypothetical protein JSU86_17305 [Phycisphaerales bacterium]